MHLFCLFFSFVPCFCFHFFLFQFLIWLSQPNWWPFEWHIDLCVVFGKLSYYARVNEYSFGWQNWYDEEAKQKFILSGPTKSKPILLLIGTCCPISTFTAINVDSVKPYAVCNVPIIFAKNSSIFLCRLSSHR